MRIAISGTHSSGKSTLIDAFLTKHPNYVHEAEAYEVLADLQSESFSAEPTAEEFVAQLNYQLGRLKLYQPNDCVIFERSPVDYLAYLQALVDLRREGADPLAFKQSFIQIKRSLHLLDVIVLLPPTGSVSEEEDPRLRRIVGELLIQFLLDDSLQLLNSGRPLVLEASGSVDDRLTTIENSVRKV